MRRGAEVVGEDRALALLAVARLAGVASVQAARVGEPPVEAARRLEEVAADRAHVPELRRRGEPARPREAPPARRRSPRSRPASFRRRSASRRSRAGRAPRCRPECRPSIRPSRSCGTTSVPPAISTAPGVAATSSRLSGRTRRRPVVTVMRERDPSRGVTRGAALPRAPPAPRRARSAASGCRPRSRRGSRSRSRRRSG